jgi:Mn-dependent DtxR family transcriptional regulator
MSTQMDPEEDFDGLHWQIIDVLREGRVTPSYLADRLGESRQLVSQRLRDLQMAGYVEKIHTGLYELVDEPEHDPTRGDE